MYITLSQQWRILSGIGHDWSYTPRMAEWMTLRQVAEYLSIPASTVYKLKARGTLRAYKIGRSLRFDRTEVDADVKRTNLHASSRKTGRKT
jgi:excisionase family DNA binding protein